MSTKVIGVGHCRTGTASLSKFLEAHGFSPCYHGWNYWDPENIQSSTIRDETLIFFEKCLIQLQNNEIPNWNDFFDTFNGACDVPIFYPPLWQSIFLNYSNKDSLKFILTIRDSNKWYQSIMTAFGDYLLKPRWYSIHLRLWHMFLKNSTMQTKKHTFGILTNTIYLMFGEYYNKNDKNITSVDDFFKPQNKKTIIDIYNKSNEHVIEWFNKKYPKYKSKLFILDLDRKDKNQMYIDLCKFLDIKLTNDKINEILNSKDEYYPRSNSTKQFEKDVNAFVFDILRPWIQLFITLIVLLIAIVSLYYRYNWQYV